MKDKGKDAITEGQPGKEEALALYDAAQSELYTGARWILHKLSQKLLDAAPDAMVFVERSGRIAQVNSQMERLFEYKREELIGMDLHTLIPERFHLQHRRNIADFFTNPRKRPMGTGLKIYGRKKDGAEFRADISLSPLDVDGDILVIAAIRDITERVRAEEQIEFNYQVQKVISAILKIGLEPVPLDEQLANTLELILSLPNPELSPKGLIYLRDDASGSLVLKAQHGFPAAQDVPEAETPACRLEYPREPRCEVSFTGSADAPYDIFFTDRSSFVHYCVPICEGEKILGMISIFAKEWPVSRPQETVFLRSVAHTLAIVIKRHQIEAERQALIAQLSQSEKLAALGRISANVAHEIRNPLTVVGGFARRLQKGVREKTQEREYADFIISEVSRLEDILKDILTYAKTTSLQLKRHRIHEIIDDVLAMYDTLCRERSITVQKFYGYTAEVSIDRNRVREVIVNLVSNALDVMPGGGTLVVATTEERVNGEVFVAARVTDSGKGIPEDTLQKIFEPFFTTKVAERGTGLGLSVSRKIMQDHGGFISVKSTVGKGSTFTLYFPQR